LGAAAGGITLLDGVAETETKLVTVCVPESARGVSVMDCESVVDDGVTDGVLKELKDSVVDVAVELRELELLLLLLLLVVVKVNVGRTGDKILDTPWPIPEVIAPRSDVRSPATLPKPDVRPPATPSNKPDLGSAPAAFWTIEPNPNPGRSCLCSRAMASINSNEVEEN